MSHPTPSRRSMDPAIRIAIFMYQDDINYVQRILAALQGFDAIPNISEIRTISATPQVISNIIPQVMKENASSWLIFYRTDRPDQLLILPFPTEDDLRFLNEINAIHSHLKDLFEIITSRREDSWYPIDGFRNLAQRTSRFRDSHQDIVWERFQVMKITQSLDTILSQSLETQGTVPVLRRASIEREISEIIKQATRGIQANREAFHSLLLDGDESRNVLIEQFDNVINGESQRIAKYIVKNLSKNTIIPDVVEKYKHLMDDTTRQFLISSETIHHYTFDETRQDFDYSLIGCGLWKSIEREMNLSLIWHLRKLNDIVDNDPMTPKSDIKEISYKAGKNKLLIHEREERTGKFKGIEIGKIEYLLRSLIDGGISQELELVFSEQKDLQLWHFVSQPKQLSDYLKELRILRNDFAHIKAMPLDKYKELRSLVLIGKSSFPEGLIKQTMEFKQAIVHYHKNRKW